MRDVLYLAWTYLAYHRIKSGVLVASITLIVYLPLGLKLLVDESSRQLTQRAAVTPLVIGAKGSPLELVLNSLYFAADVPAPIRHGELQRVQRTQLALAVPLYTRFRTAHSPIVGTSLEYFEQRGLRLARGRWFGMLGECVLGSKAARATDAGVGGTVMSQRESVFDIAGGAPLNMHIVGVLEPTGTADDEAVFVDVRTTWVIQGLAHGHDDLSRPESADAVLRQEGNEIVANRSVMEFNEITQENVGSFHFHGDPAEFPITAVVAFPPDRKANTLLQGRYVGDQETVQITRPVEVINELLRTVLTVERYVMLAVSLVALATLATMFLVFMLSLQLRRRELQTMMKIGGSRGRVVAIVATEIVGVLVAGLLLAGLLAWATHWLAPRALQALVQLA